MSKKKKAVFFYAIVTGNVTKIVTIEVQMLK